MAVARKQIKNGSFLGACKIVRLLGRGSMGETYEAQDVLLDRHVVVKVVSPFIADSTEVVRRFKATGQALARINHQNIAMVYSLKEIDTVHYIVMEYVEGRTLKDIIRVEGSLTAGSAIKCFRQVLEGIKGLHDAGIIHQDIKPKNIIVRQDNFVKVVDFGIGRIDGQEIVGTIYYLAPEVIDGDTGSIQSDIWSLGITLYESLTGQKPFQAEDWAEVRKNIAEAPLTFPEELIERVPLGLQHIVLKMCEKSPEARYGSILEILEDLKNLETIGTITVPPSLELTVPPSVRRDESSYSSSSSHTLSSLNPVPQTGSGTFAPLPVPAPKNKSKTVLVAGVMVALGAGIWFVQHRPTNAGAPEPVAQVTPRDANSPSEGEQIQLAETDNVKFVWSQPPRGGVYLEVARDRDFKTRVVREAYRSSPYLPSKPLKEGKYYWRLIDQSATPAKNLVEPTSFTVVSMAAPKVMYPSNNYLSRETKPMQFFWLNKFGVDTYRFQVSSDSNFEKLVTNVLVEAIQSDPIALPPGDYFWRVRAEDTHSVTSSWSEPRALHMNPPLGKDSLASATKQPEPVEMARVPEPVAPPPQRPAVTKREVPQMPPKVVQKVAAAPVPVAKSLKKPEPVKSKRNSHKETVAKLTPLKETSRKPAAAAGKKSLVDVVPPPPIKRRVADSDSSTAAIAKPDGPRLKLPPDGVSIVSLNGSQDPVMFRWESQGDDVNYRLQLASDASFSQIILNTSSRENQFTVTKRLPEGKIFWRVRNEDAKSAWSKTYSIEVGN